MSIKTAMITGASGGIGRACALALARAGYAVSIMGRGGIEAYRPVLEEISAIGVPYSYMQGDVTSAESRQAFVDLTMEKFGRIDFLMNNAGVAPKVRADLLEMSEESFDYVLSVNLRGNFFMTQAAAKAMVSCVEQGITSGGYIVTVTSVSAYTSSVNRGEYCISKAGLSMMTKLFADKLAPYGIHTFEIRPGIIRTDMTAKVADKYDKLIAEGLTPIKRWGEPEDVGLAVSAIAEGKLPFATGSVIDVDGGFGLRSL